MAAYLLVLAHTLPLAVRRRWPVAVLAVGLGTGAAFALLGFNLVVLTFALLGYVYTVATRRPRRVSLTGLVARGRDPAAAGGGCHRRAAGGRARAGP